MFWYRRPGSFCIARRITDSAISVISRCGANSRGDGGAVWMCIDRTSLDCGASNGGRPHSMSNRITPSERSEERRVGKECRDGEATADRRIKEIEAAHAIATK